MDQLNEICQSEREDWKLKEISEHIKCFNDTEQLECSAPGLRVVSNSGKCIFFILFRIAELEATRIIAMKRDYIWPSSQL